MAKKERLELGGSRMEGGSVFVNAVPVAVDVSDSVVNRGQPRTTRVIHEQNPSVGDNGGVQCCYPVSGQARALPCKARFACSTNCFTVGHQKSSICSQVYYQRQDSFVVPNT